MGLTVHVTAQHGLLQGMSTALLQSFFGWGRVQTDEVLEGTITAGFTSPIPCCPVPAVCQGVGPYLAERGTGWVFHSPAVAVQQLPGVLDSFGHCIPFAKKTCGGRQLSQYP